MDPDKKHGRTIFWLEWSKFLTIAGTVIGLTAASDPALKYGGFALLGLLGALTLWRTRKYLDQIGEDE